MGRPWHPFVYCAVRPCCCCCYIDSEVTCFIIGVYCLLFLGFSGLTFLATGHWTVFSLSILNTLLHIFAGSALILGTLWGNYNLKICFCWLLTLAIFISLANFIAIIIEYETTEISPVDFDLDNRSGRIIYVMMATLVTIGSDVYSIMLAIGNIGDDEPAVY